MKCLALFSGGLDSMLAIKLMSDQGIRVHALNIDIAFGPSGPAYFKMADRAAQAGATFEVYDARQKYIDEVLFSPKYGYGKAFNPCVDCHGFMFRTALGLLEEMGASFIISGEVVGQRPMSQRSDAMNSVKNLAGEKNDLVLRPLCAKLLPPTTPELNGWVDRDKLLDISGRGRTRQMELARAFGLNDYETPGGGCPLTLAAFATKIRDLKSHKNGDILADELQSLRFGRHLRLPGGAKMIIGRNEDENDSLSELELPQMTHIKHTEIGAFCLVDEGASEEDLTLAARLALTYAKSDSAKTYEVQISNRHFEVSPFSDKSVAGPLFVN